MIECILSWLCLLQYFSNMEDSSMLIACGIFAIASQLAQMNKKKEE